MTKSNYEGCEWQYTRLANCPITHWISKMVWNPPYAWSRRVTKMWLLWNTTNTSGGLKEFTNRKWKIKDWLYHQWMDFYTLKLNKTNGCMYWKKVEEALCTDKVGFIGARLSFCIVRSTSVCLRGSRTRWRNGLDSTMGQYFLLYHALYINIVILT